MLASPASSLRLSSGPRLEVIKSSATRPHTGAKKPPLLFVHGSYHGAWCWAEHYQPYFADAGYDSWAVSLRAQGRSDPAPQGSAVAGTLDSHAADLAEVVSAMDTAPVMVAHSFGGLIAQQYLLNMAPPPLASSSGDANRGSSSKEGRGDSGGAAATMYPRLAGAALLASVPHSGNADLIWRWLRRDIALSWRVTWAFVGKSFARSVEEAQFAFFSDDLPPEDAARYQRSLAACSPTRLLDLRDVSRRVPLPAPATPPPIFVLGAAEDRILDEQAVQELARHLNVTPTLLPGLAHDVMLDTRWGDAAGALRKWLDETDFSCD